MLTLGTDALSGVTDTVGNTVKGATDTAGNAASGLGKRIPSQLSLWCTLMCIGDTVSGTAKGATDTVSGAGKSAGDTASGAAQGAGDKTKQATGHDAQNPLGLSS